jgi:putative membrane protein
MVMATFPLSDADRELVGAAVGAAEAGTDGEILTIITPRSDEYRDTGLIVAAMAMLLVVALAAAMPNWVDAKIALLTGGWGEAPSMAMRFLALLVIEAVIFAVVLLAFRAPRLRVALTPKGLKAHRVRGRAIRYFKVGAEKRTAARVGVLLYLSLDERLAEIVADEAIHAKVPPERWGDAMVALVDEVRAGRPAAGMAAAVGAIGAIIAEHFPKTDADVNELPDRLIEL